MRPWYAIRGFRAGARVLQVVLLFISTVLSSAVATSPEGLVRLGGAAPFLERLVVYAQGAAWSVPILILVSGVLEIIIKVAGNPRDWDTIDVFLDSFRERMFQRDGASSGRVDRVTLFRFKKRSLKIREWSGFGPGKGYHFCRPRVAGCLVPVARSGHVGQKSRTRFWIPEEGKSDGIAGWAWETKTTVVVKGLPDVSGNPTDDEVRRYAKDTRISEEWVRGRRPTARALCGMYVESNGNPWGVVVVDTWSEKLVERRARQFHDSFAGVLGHILKGV